MLAEYENVWLPSGERSVANVIVVFSRFRYRSEHLRAYGIYIYSGNACTFKMASSLAHPGLFSPYKIGLDAPGYGGCLVPVKIHHVRMSGHFIVS